MGKPTLDVAFFIPRDIGWAKRILFQSLSNGFRTTIKGDIAALDRLPENVIPMIGCTLELRPLINRWIENKRSFLYWDRGYWARQCFTGLPRGHGNGNYRVHLNSFQAQAIYDVSSDRISICRPPIRPWRKQGKHIIVAAPSPAYAAFHGLDHWTRHTVEMLKLHTDRPIRIREKSASNSLVSALDGAHALVTHGSNTAVEAVILGVPVFVDQSSAASLIGLTDLSQIENPITPDREPWLRSLAYCQFTDQELANGTAVRIVGEHQWRRKLEGRSLEQGAASAL